MSPARAASRLYAQALTQVDDLGDNRTACLLERRQGIPPLLWVVLKVGGVLKIAFTFLFGMEVPWLHGVSIAALTVVIVLILCAIYRIQYPLTSDVLLEPDAFKLGLQQQVL